MLESRRLQLAVEEFGEAMASRLIDRYQCGWRGWEDKRNEANILNGLCRDCNKLPDVGEHISTIDPQLLIDIANRAMMLWRFRIEDGKFKKSGI